MGVFTPDKNCFASGTPSLRIDNKSGKFHSILVQWIKLESNAEYKISYFIKGEKIQGRGQFDGGAVYLMDKGNPLFSMGRGLYRHAQGSFDWQRVEHTFRTKTLQSPNIALVVSLRGASGSVWFDDFSIEAVRKEKSAPVTTNLYPVDYQNSSWFLCREFPSPLLFRVTLDRKRIPGNHLELVLDLPEGVEYLHSGALLPAGNAENKPVFEKDSVKKTPLRRDGKNYWRHTLTLAPGFTGKLNTTHGWENYNRIYLKTSLPAGTAGNVHWHLRSRTETFPEQSFRLTVLPELELPENPCRKFQLCLARLWHMNTLPSISSAYVKLWTSLQERPWTSDPYYIGAYPEEEKRKVFDNFHYCSHLASSRGMPWLSSLYNAVAQNRFPGKIPPALGPDGKAFPVSISPWYLIEDPDNLIWGKLFDEYAATIRKNPQIQAIAIDFEPGAMTHCFSLENRKRFASYAKLKNIPAAEEILSRLRAEWLAFRIEQHRRIIRRLSEAIRSRLPGIGFWLISDPLQTGSRRVAEWCGVDVKASDPDIDIHQDMPYFAGAAFFETMKLNIAELDKPCFPLIDPSENMEMYYKRYTPETVKQNILITAALGGYGIGFWPNDVFDGRYLEAIKEGYRIVGTVEDFYAEPPLKKPSFRAVCRNVTRFEAIGANGKKVMLTIPQLDRNIRVLHHRKDSGDLLTIFNFSSALPAILELALPGASGKEYVVDELVRRVRLTENAGNLSGTAVRKGFLLEVPPNGSAVVRILPGGGAAADGQRVEQAAFRARLEAFRKQAAGKNQIKPYRDSRSAVSWGVLPDSDKAVLFLEQGAARIGIDALSGGDVVAWQKHGAQGGDALFHRERGFLGRFLLNAPEQLPNLYQFEAESVSRNNGNPAITFSCQVSDFTDASAVENPLAGLRIRKTVSLSEQGSGITLRLQFTNPREKTMIFSFRINNLPKIGGRLAGEEPLVKITKISCGAQSFTPGVPQSERLFLASPDAAPELRRNLLFGRLKAETVTPGPVAVQSGIGRKELLTLTTCPDTAGFYSWSNIDGGYTVEPVSTMIRLAPGAVYEWKIDYHLN